MTIMFSKRHFWFIANIIKESANKDILIDRLVLEFQADNPNFKPDLFRKACGQKLAPVVVHPEQNLTAEQILEIQHSKLSSLKASRVYGVKRETIRKIRGF